MTRVHNFSAGPAALPLPVLERMRDELLDFGGSGASILEQSHRGPVFSRVLDEAEERLRRLAGISDDHAVLFMAGGARTQFSAVPMNLRAAGGRAAYLTTGRWSELAIEAGARYGEVRELYSSAATGFDRVPAAGDFAPDSGAAYLHYTSNNTVWGTQYAEPPDPGGAPLVADMSSDVLSRPLDVSRFGVIYASAQKNLGPAGVTLVVVRRDLLERSPGDLPETLSYRVMAAKRSLVNTPPVFAIYVCGLVLEWIEERGGLEAMARRNRDQADAVYRAIDGSGGFYRGLAQPASRSQMNVTFRLPSPELEERFVAEAAEAGMAALKGYRLVGGVRASIYNAQTGAAVAALVDFMGDFQRRAG